MIVDIKKLREAIEEVAEIAREGHEANEELFVEIAAAYGLRPELLTRKFHEQFPHGVGDRLATRWDNIRRLVAAMAEDERRFREDPPDRRFFGPGASVHRLLQPIAPSLRRVFLQGDQAQGWDAGGGFR